MHWLMAIFLSAGSLLGPLVADTWNELCPLFPSQRDRIGFNFSPLHGEIASDFDVAKLQAAWYNDYQVQTAPDKPADLIYVQTLFSGGSSTLSTTQKADLQAAVLANPGSLWLAGNEPDREGIQDDMLPADYADYYHAVYTFIKSIDPTARVATAGIVQATPIRLRYLDQVLAAYRARYQQPMPVDIWNIHNFVLREQLGSWGAGIPPGLEAYAAEGKLYEVSDNGNFDLFRGQIIDFRRWMAANGYHNTPLIVSEFGILMPVIYGFSDEIVAQFLTDTFDFFLTATDDAIGYPEDGNRLVQAWSWFSLNERPYDLETEFGFNGHLYDVAADRWTKAGDAFAGFTAPLVDSYTDLAVAAIESDTGYFIPSHRTQVTVTVTLLNGGSTSAGSGVVELWLGDTPDNGGTKIGQVTFSNQPSHCRTPRHLAFTVAANTLPTGPFPLWARLISDEPSSERNTANHLMTTEFYRLATDKPLYFLRLPHLQR